MQINDPHDYFALRAITAIRCYERVMQLEGTKDHNDIHGYFSTYELQRVQYMNAQKRTRLSKYIRQIYASQDKDQDMPLSSLPNEFNRMQLLSMLNRSLLPKRIPNGDERVERCKRILFREPRHKLRKQRFPKRNWHCRFEAYHFKARRRSHGVRKICRGYLKEGRRIVEAQNKHVDDKDGSAAERIDDEQIAGPPFPDSTTPPATAHNCNGCFQAAEDYYGDCMLHGPTVRRRELHPTSQTTAQTQREYHQNLVAQHLYDQAIASQYREHCRENERMMEESIRSIYYIKSLLSIMRRHELRLNLRVSHEENYDENQNQPDAENLNQPGADNPNPQNNVNLIQQNEDHENPQSVENQSQQVGEDHIPEHEYVTEEDDAKRQEYVDVDNDEEEDEIMVMT